MHATSEPRAAETAPTHELCFASLHDPGRAVAIPCDAAGRVDLDRLPEKLRLSYLAARAMIGRDFRFPTVAPRH